MRLRLYDVIPKDQVWMVPPDLQEPRPSESVESWVQRVVDAAKQGRIAIITNVAPARAAESEDKGEGR